MHRAATILIAGLSLVATGVVAGLAAGGRTGDPPPRIAFVANGVNPADALAAGSVAGQLGAPVFTTAADSLEQATADGLADYSADLVIVLGGPVAITDAVIDELETATGLPFEPTGPGTQGGIVRVAGETRYETAAAIADLLATFNPAYLPFKETAANAERLAGLDASEFQRAEVAVGETLTGGWHIDVDKPSTDGDFGTPIPFPVPLSVAPTTYVYVETDTTEQGCSGTADAPTAEPGHFCAYEDFRSGLDTPVVFSPGGEVTNGTRLAAMNFGNDGTAGDGYAGGTWAVTPGAVGRGGHTEDVGREP